jgi:hypothetical protein
LNALIKGRGRSRNRCADGNEAKRRHASSENGFKILRKKILLISYNYGVASMPQVKLREKGQVTIPAELLQEWSKKNHVSINDSMEARLSNGVLMLIPQKRHLAKRSVMSFAGVGKGLWGNTPAEVDASLKEIRDTWKR